MINSPIQSRTTSFCKYSTNVLACFEKSIHRTNRNLPTTRVFCAFEHAEKRQSLASLSPTHSYTQILINRKFNKFNQSLFCVPDVSAPCWALWDVLSQ